MNKYNVKIRHGLTGNSTPAITYTLQTKGSPRNIVSKIRIENTLSGDVYIADAHVESKFRHQGICKKFLIYILENYYISLNGDITVKAEAQNTNTPYNAPGRCYNAAVETVFGNRIKTRPRVVSGNMNWTIKPPPKPLISNEKIREIFFRHLGAGAVMPKTNHNENVSFLTKNDYDFIFKHRRFEPRKNFEIRMSKYTPQQINTLARVTGMRNYIINQH